MSGTSNSKHCFGKGYMSRAYAAQGRHVTCASLHLYLDTPPPSAHHRTQGGKLVRLGGAKKRSKHISTHTSE